MDEDIPVSAVEDDALPSLDGTVAEDMSVGEAQDRQHSPRERPLASTDWGTTALEEVRGEPLDARLAREEPDLTPSSEWSGEDDGPYPAEPGGRLVAPDEGAHGDTEADLVASDVGRDRGGRTAEEAAIRIVGEVPGGNWSATDGYLDDAATEAGGEPPDG